MKTMFKKVLSVLFVVLMMQMCFVSVFAEEEVCEHLLYNYYDEENYVLTIGTSSICHEICTARHYTCLTCGYEWTKHINTKEIVLEHDLVGENTYLGDGKYHVHIECSTCGWVHTDEIIENYSLD